MMWRKKNRRTAGGPCDEFEPLLILLAAGEELDAAEQQGVQVHLAECTACRASLEREQELLALIAEHRREPDAPLLASCRASLEDTLDREEEAGWLGWLRRAAAAVVPNWLAAPSWSGAVLVAIGFSVGVMGPHLLLHRPVKNAPVVSPGASNGTSIVSNSPNGAAPGAANDAATPPSHSARGPLDLRTADFAGINVLPSGGDDLPQVRLQLRAQQPVMVEGTVNDDDVKQVLLYVLNNNEKFCSGMRLDAVNLLRARNGDPDVRSTLCRTVRGDANPAVRMKAVEALDGAGPEDIVRQTLLDALANDQSAGVRTEAIDALRDMVSRGEIIADDRSLAVLRDRMANDPDTYVRAQSAAAIQDLAPR